MRKVSGRCEKLVAGAKKLVGCEKVSVRCEKVVDWAES